MVTPARYFDTNSGKRAVYYYTNWSAYGRNYMVSDLPIDKITDISYAFFNIDATGRVFSSDEWIDYQNTFSGRSVTPASTWNSPPEQLGLFGQFRKLLDQGKKFNLTLAIGGWTFSKYFSQAVSTQTNRQNIVNSLTALFTKYPNLFNGISLDWEYVSNDGVNYGLDGNAVNKQDSANFVLLLKMLKTSFPGFKIQFCVTAAPEKAHFDFDQIHPLIDQLHVMTYDFHSGAWGETKTAHHTNSRKSSAGIWSAEEAINFYISKGIPSTKIYIGGAFYSRGFANTTGFGQPASGNSPDFQFAEEMGVVPYHMLPVAGATESVDPESRGAYSYDPIRKVVNTYDNVASIKDKCSLIFQKNLGGLLIWEVSGDIKDSNNPRSLVKAISENLTSTTNPNPTPVPTPVPVPVPVPTPVPVPAPQPISCTFCTVCSKASANTPCTLRTVAPIPIPTPTPVPVPVPDPSIKDWAIGVAYKIGDVVNYNGKRYTNIQSHISNSAWTPDVVPALWKPL
jgi:chitinase